MPAAPPNKISLSRAATRLVVLLGNKDGDAPTAADEVDFLKPITIERRAGGSQVHRIILDYDLGETGEHIVDTLTPKEISRQVEVREVDALGKLVRILAWGKLAAQPIALGDTESIQYIVRIDKHLFGEPLGKIPFWDAQNLVVIEVDRAIIFNPEIDDKIQKNKSDKQWSTHGNMSIWFDAAAINSAAARTQHGQTPALWRVFEAVHALCWLCNPNETFIKNPTRADLSIDLGDVDASHDVLRNLEVKPGGSLPELLDQLLTPFACSWTIDFATVSGATEKKLRFFRRNEGDKKQLYLQRPGEALDPAKSFVPQLSINFDISNLANKIIGYTSRKQREGTFELNIGWPVSEDSLDRDALMKDPALRKLHPHAGSKFVLNESGAWNILRPGITWFDLKSLFDGDPTVATCRKFLPCLSRVIDGATDKLESRGYVLEFYNVDSTETNKWELRTWGFSVLQLECGIFFDVIPKELWDALQTNPANCRIRITATIEGDTRTYATADRQESSPNSDDVVMTLDLSDKFHDRKVHSTSQYYGDRANADEADDIIPLQAEVARIRGIEDSAELSCSAVLEGLDHDEYKIGDLITDVKGRNLQLGRNNPSLFTPQRYLQIMGINYDIRGQRTELLLESTDEETL